MLMPRVYPRSHVSFTFFVHLFRSPMTLFTCFAHLLCPPVSLTYFVHLFRSHTSFTFFIQLRPPPPPPPPPSPSPSSAVEVTPVCTRNQTHIRATWDANSSPRSRTTTLEREQQAANNAPALEKGCPTHLLNLPVIFPPTHSPTHTPPVLDHRQLELSTRDDTVAPQYRPLD